MEDRLNGRGPALALLALGAILLITVAWWMLALWPMPTTTPAWLLRTREVCFGSPADGLPSAGGWVLLIGEPIGMAGTLAAIAGRELRIGLRAAWSRLPGRLTLATAALLVLVGLGATARRVAGAKPAPPSDDPRIATVDRPVPSFHLIDQTGAPITTADLGNGPVVFAFAFGHCVTVCPAIIEQVRRAVAAVPQARGVILTVDPWREPPERLPALADRWRLSDRILLLSGTVDSVTAALSRFGVRTIRDTLTGDVTHTALAQVVDRTGKIRYLVSGSSTALTDALRLAQLSR